MEPYVHLTRSEYRLLECLQDAKGRVVTYEHASEYALGYESRANIKTHLCRLRRKIPELQVDVIEGLGMRLPVTPPCPHCKGTGFALFEADAAL